jgi:hypothetical protein
MLMFFSCSPNKNFLEGNTVVTVEYYDVEEQEQKEDGLCYPNFKCENIKKEECVFLLHKETKDGMRRSLNSFKKNKDVGLLKNRFQLALCNILNIDGLLKQLKKENYEKWNILRKSGFIEHIGTTGLAISMLIKQAESL